MGITYGAGPGSVVTSYAMNETLSDQSQQSNDNTVVVSDDIGTAGNGQIGTKYATYVGRKVIIELDETDEQERMVISQVAGTGNTIILTVHEDWDVNPVSGDTIHVMYNVDDIETGGAGGGIGLSSKTGLYELSNVLTVGNGTDPAGLLLHDGTALECDDRGADISFQISAEGRFDVGYMAAGQPVNGGVITAYNNTDDERWMYWAASSKGHVNDCLFWSQLKCLDFINLNNCHVVFRKVKILFGTTGMELMDSEYYDCTIQGKPGVSNQVIRIDADTVIERMVAISMTWFTTAVSSSTTETLTLRDVVFISMTRFINIAANKTWDVINPVWSVVESDQTSLLFTDTSGVVNERYSIDAIVSEADGTAIQNAVVVIYENTTLADLVLELVSDSDGIVADSWVYKKYVYLTSTTMTVTTYGGHALRSDCWLFQPFVASQVASEKFEGGITLLPDNNIAQTTQATAKAAGDPFVDSYSESNQSSNVRVSGGWYNSAGQTFTSGAATKVLSKAKFYVKKVGSPTGTAIAELYATSGGVPTGSALATSETIDVSTFGTTHSLKELIFLDEYEMAASTLYCIAITYTGGGGTDYLDVGLDDTTPTHAGVGYRETSGWYAAGGDVCFYLEVAGIVWNEDTNPSSIIAFTGGSGTLAVGDTVTGGTSGADGVVTKIMAGNSVAGTIHLKTRDAVDFSGTETLSNGSGWTATLTSGSQQDFSIWIDGNDLSFQAIYDYLAALTSETALSATGELIHEWGRDSQGRALYFGASGFYTDRSYGKGIFITKFGAGVLDVFTDDAGGTISFTSYTQTLTGLAENTEVTYTKKPTPYDNLTFLAAIAGERKFFDILASWTTDEFKGKLLVVTTAGANAGRYYVTSNNNTEIYVDKVIAESAAPLSATVYGDFDVVDQTENVPASGINTYSYEYVASSYVDILIFHVNYEDIVLEDVLLDQANQTIPITQIPDVNYYNPT